MIKIKNQIRKIQQKNIERKYIPNGDFRRLESIIETTFREMIERIDEIEIIVPEDLFNHKNSESIVLIVDQIKDKFKSIIKNDKEK